MIVHYAQLEVHGVLKEALLLHHALLVTIALLSELSLQLNMVALLVLGQQLVLLMHLHHVATVVLVNGAERDLFQQLLTKIDVLLLTWIALLVLIDLSPVLQDNTLIPQLVLAQLALPVLTVSEMLANLNAQKVTNQQEVLQFVAPLLLELLL